MDLSELDGMPKDTNSDSMTSEQLEEENALQKDLDEVIVEGMKAAGVSQNCPTRQRVARLILSRPGDDIVSFLIKRSNNSWQETLEYLKAIFNALGPSALESHSSKSGRLLVSIFVTVIDLVHSHGAVDNRIGDCVNFLIQEMERLPLKLLPTIAESILSHLDNGADQDLLDSGESRYQHLLEFLPRCLGLIVSAESVLLPSEGEDSTSMSGAQYREVMLKRLLAMCWSKKFVTKMASLLRELPLETGEMDGFVRKLFFHMKDAEPQDLPSLAYQLLLLASKGFKRIVMIGLINFFNKLHTFETNRRNRAGKGQAFRPKPSVDAFRQIEGTVVLHINFAVKQDPALGQELLYLVRTNAWPSTPFLVSVLLSIGRIQRFEQASFDLLKAAAVKCYKDCQQCRDSRLAASILGAKCMQAAKEMEQSFMRTVQSSSFGWDHIIPSVVRLGFCLIESVGVGRPRLDESSRLLDQVSLTQELGIRVLTAAFEVHEMARDEIIEQCKCRILGLRPQHSAPIIRVIVQLVKGCPQLMLEHSSRLKECLDYFTFLSSTAASSLLQAICPLFQISRDLQDYTILVLRKAMFGREESARMTAVQGLLELIIAEKQARMYDSDAVNYRNRYSEASCSQSSSQLERIRLSGKTNVNLLQDLLGLLRRCLSQQVNVRETLYQGLPKLLQVDPDAAENIFDLIFPHFSRFYLSGPENTVSFELDLCVVVQNDKVRVVEPLDHLLSCIHQLLVLQRTGSAHSMAAFEEQEASKPSSAESLGMAFHSIRKTVNTSSLGDFYRDKTLEFSPDTIEGEKNLEQAWLLLGVLEVLMDCAVQDCLRQSSITRRVEIEKELHSYLDLHDSLFQMLVQKQVKSAAKVSGKVGSKGRGKVAASKDPGVQNVGKSVNFSAPRNLVDKRKPLLSSVCIVYLLNRYASYLHPRNSVGIGERGSQSAGRQAGTEGASQREFKGNESRIASFALHTCTRHFKTIGCDVFEQEPTRVGNTDWKQLASPLFRVVRALSLSGKSTAQGTQDGTKGKGKPARGKKSDNEMCEGLLPTAIKCLDELMNIAIRKGCLLEIIKQINIDCNESSEEQVADDKDDENQESDEETAFSANYQGETYVESEAKLIHNWLLNEFRPILQALLSRAHYPDVEVFASLYERLGSKLPQGLMKRHGSWAHLTCKEQGVRHVGAARSLTSLAICLNTAPHDLVVAQSFAAELLMVVGSDEHEAVDSSEQYPLINKATRAAVGGFLLQRAEIALVDLEWLVSKLKIQACLEVDQKTPLHPGGSQRPGNSQRAILEETLYTRLESTVSVLSLFTTMTLSGPLAEQLLKSATRFYKCLAAATRLLIAPKGVMQVPPSIRFQKLAEATCKKLTAPIYTFMSAMQRDQQDVSISKARGTVSQIKREGRTIPNLIYHIEEGERYLIQLSKVSNVNLLRAAKRSTARDFKIVEKHGKKRKQTRSEVAENEEPDEHKDEDEHEACPEESEGEEDIQARDEETSGNRDETAEEDTEVAVNIHEGKSRSRIGRPSRSRVIQDSDDSDDDSNANHKRQRSS
ncbi:hypothetical protein Mapa_014156 [Marchantia paleacea]|nr:hypothetical protein Mapa_014156 [Marchantia paleacea]